MILPVGANSFKEAMRMGSEVYHHLKVGVCTFSGMDANLYPTVFSAILWKVLGRFLSILNESAFPMNGKNGVFSLVGDSPD